MIAQERVETFFRQASMTAATYFHEAIAKIDEHFGAGYSEAHPELVGQFMMTAAMDFKACIESEQLNAIADNIELISEKLGYDIACAIGDHGRRLVGKEL